MTNGESGTDPLDVLYLLHRQLRLVSPALTVAPESREVRAMLVGLAETTNRAAPLLASVEPGALAALEQAFRHARAGRPDETNSELIGAYGRLSVLLRRDAPRREAAANEPTVRWIVPD